MKLFRAFMISWLLLLPAVGSAKDAYVSMIYSNAMDEKLPYSIFEKGGWQPVPSARFVKLHMYFDEPVMVKSVAVDTCGKPIDSKVYSFLNFDESVINLDASGSRNVWTLTANEPKELQSGIVFRELQESIELRSLTFNFEKNTNFKVCGIILKDEKGEQYNIRPPKVVPGSVSASSVLAPESAYAPVYLFDSRFEYGWASNKQAKDVDLVFDFAEPTRVERIRLWNGYQRSETHCIANSRAKTLRITGDGGYDEQVTVQDIMGSQVITLSRPFEGKHLKFSVVDSFRGKSYADLVISELRFYNGKEWFMLDPTEKLRESIEENRRRFSAAGLDFILNDSFRTRGHTPEQDEENGWLDARLRLRADGSFFIDGGNIDAEGEAFFALGNFEIKQADQENGLKLRLFGLLYKYAFDYSDCNGCGRDCNTANQPVEDGDERKYRIFQEVVILKPLPNGLLQMVNVSGGKKLPFKQFKMEREDE